jgi:hypothetical protein
VDIDWSYICSLGCPGIQFFTVPQIGKSIANILAMFKKTGQAI